MHLLYIINQMKKVFGSQEPTPTAPKSIANQTSIEMREIVQRHERAKRDIIHPMLRGLGK